MKSIVPASKLELPLTREVLKDSKYKCPIARSELALKLNLTPPLIDCLINDKENMVRVAIAQHPNLKPSQIEALSKDKHEAVRCMIAKRKDLTLTQVCRLLTDKNEDVTHEILHNLHVQKLLNSK